MFPIEHLSTRNAKFCDRPAQRTKVATAILATQGTVLQIGTARKNGTLFWRARPSCASGRRSNGLQLRAADWGDGNERMVADVMRPGFAQGFVRVRQ
jgi:hypothetical protein